VIPLINLRSLDCDISFQEPIYAGTPFRVDVTVNNRKKLPSYSVSLELSDYMDSLIYFSTINKGINKSSFGNVVINRRGKYSLDQIRLRTGFPFIFMYTNRKLPFDRELIVYPEIFDVAHLISEFESSASERDTIRVGQDGEYFSAREYVYGEESRRIDWKTSARKLKTMVKEYSRREDRLATVVLDNGAPGREDDFERSVSLAASLCDELIGRGYYVRLITCKKVIPFGNGRAHLFKILDILAELSQFDVFECQIGETIEGLSILVRSSDRSGFERISQLCSGVIDARDL
jgi:uncharacterized protein (DUF58 family)